MITEGERERERKRNGERECQSERESFNGLKRDDGQRVSETESERVSQRIH